MSEIIKRLPNFQTLSDLHAAYEQWRIKMGLSNVETSQDIGIKLLEEIYELQEAVDLYPRVANRLEVAGEAADVFFFGMVSAHEVSGITLGDVLRLNGLQGGAFDNLERHAYRLISYNNIQTPGQIMPQLNDTAEFIVANFDNLHSADPTIARWGDLLLFSSMIIQTVNLPIGSTLAGKFHRNTYKYHPNGLTMNEQRNGWERKLDNQFLLLQLGEIDQIEL